MIMSQRVCASVYCEIGPESANGNLPLLLSGVSVYDYVLGLAVDVHIEVPLHGGCGRGCEGSERGVRCFLRSR